MKRFLSIVITCSCLAWSAPAQAQLSSTGATLFDLPAILSGSVSGGLYHLAIETTGTSNRISLSELSKAVLVASTLTGSTGINVNTATGVILNTGVTSLTGPSDHFLLSAVSGNITISLPQSISTTASPTFAGLTLNGSLSLTGNASILGSITGSSLSLTGGIIADSLTLTNGLTSSTASVTTGTIGTATSTTQVVLGSLFLNNKNGPSIFSNGTAITLSAVAGNVSITGSNAAGGNLLSNRVTASNWLRATGTATIDGASTFGGLMTVNADVTSTGNGTFGGLISTTHINSGLGLFGNLQSSNGIVGGTLNLTGVSTLGGAMQLNNNLSVTGTANIFGATTLSGPVTMSNTLIVYGGSTLATLTVNGGALTLTGSTAELKMRNSSNSKIDWGTAGTKYGKLDATVNAAYLQLLQGSGIAFGASSSPTVGVLSSSSGVARLTDATASGFGRWEQSSVLPVSSVTNSVLSSTNGALTFSGAITTTLASAATVGAGRLVFVANVGASTGTLTGTGGQTIGGATTLTVPGNSGRILMSDGSNYFPLGN